VPCAHVIERHGGRNLGGVRVAARGCVLLHTRANGRLKLSPAGSARQFLSRARNSDAAQGARLSTRAFP
jgi:hypothetical protein